MAGSLNTQPSIPAIPAPFQPTNAPTTAPSFAMSRSNAPNVFQQSAGALQQAQQTAGNLANFQVQPMQAAQIGPTATYGGATIAPTAQMGAANLGRASTMRGVGQVGNINAPGQIGVNQLASTNLNAYMNPYIQNVVELGQQDIERQRQMASNQLGAQAQAAGAFGGSRQAVQEAQLASEAMRQAGQLSAQQRQSGFQQALQSGQFDIGQMQAARTLASQQDMQARTLNQQASDAAAQREQAARAGNMQAANQFAQQQAQFEQQARAANQQAANARAQQQASLAQQAGLSNQAAINAARQQQAAFQQAANQATFGGQFQGAGIQANAASQLGGLAQTGFGMGQSIQQQQMQQGALQQALQQQLIDAARGQYQGFIGAPQTALGLPLQALGAAPVPQTSTQTQSRQPGLFDYLTGAAALGSMSDPRLKTNVQHKGQFNGVNFYSWDWNDEGKRVANPDQPTFGVMADELQKTHPQHVMRGEDGYLRVKYAELMRELVEAA